MWQFNFGKLEFQLPIFQAIIALDIKFFSTCVLAGVVAPIFGLDAFFFACIFVF